jgi:hypothetical protein
MHSHDRLLALWNALTAYVLAPLVVFSVVLGWPGLVQLTLTLLMGIAAFAPQAVLARTRRR